MVPDGDALPGAAPLGAGLTQHQRRMLAVRVVARVIVLTVLLLVAYFAAPIGQDADLTGIVVLAVGLVGFVALAVYQIRRILDSPMPQLRAAETLATVVPLVIVAFALFYVAMSDADPNGFTEPMTKVNGLYFTVTVLATVGFGDIAARTDAARIAVTVQMIVDLLIIGVLVKVILGASRIAVERRRAEAEDRAGPGATGSGPPS
jgi:voltage-gated potassium channel